MDRSVNQRLLLLHGPGIVSSRKKLSEIRAKFDQENTVELGKETSWKEIRVVLQSRQLLPGDRLIVIENPAEDSVLDKLTNSYLVDTQTTLVIWCDHGVDDKKPIIGFVQDSGGQIWPFPESKENNIFPFLDCLGNRDMKAFWELDKLKRLETDTQYIFTMVFYLLRGLVNPGQSNSAFVRQKFTRQQANFSPQELIDLYRDILQIDFKIKKGLMEVSQAQFLLVSKFVKS